MEHLQLGRAYCQILSFYHLGFRLRRTSQLTNKNLYHNLLMSQLPSALELSYMQLLGSQISQVLDQ